MARPNNHDTWSSRPGGGLTHDTWLALNMALHRASSAMVATRTSNFLSSSGFLST
eukprot:CAMPEP_0172894064 /NCGR_PEP_ID=MMETSP1075-20121228/150060_1 /TAXON_ID=2916 /ORGANISM="Ceratium fusus, Strain PA161109" /LENGTH=54 /DNA_ID=CAMNT_0013749025 /DNA_START=105 /DNA_END=269 /DNA_ORIENTATION=-